MDFIPPRWHGRSHVSVLGIIASMLLVSGCDRRMSDVPTPMGQPRVQLRCHQRSTVLQCQAFAFDEPMTDVGEGRDVTDTVRWTSSDDQAVSVLGGRIRAGQGGTAVVTASWTERPVAASASVLVVADARHGDARQAYVLEGEVRTFPTSDGVAGARVTLTDNTGVEQTVTTPSPGGTQGQFRFVPVAGGTYQLRAARDGYHSRQVTVVLPDDRLHTITLLHEPRDHS
jgi:hypothetical protein